MLFLLREEGGFEGWMLGVDYSSRSVELCRRLAETKGLLIDQKERGGKKLEFKMWDITGEEGLVEAEEGFDVVLDKGTFDAISLSDEKDAQGRRICEGYRERVEGLVRDGGILLVTSCNWTEQELKGWFESDRGFEARGRIEYPSFSFGGQTGQSVCSVCFRRKRKIH